MAGRRGEATRYVRDRGSFGPLGTLRLVGGGARGLCAAGGGTAGRGPGAAAGFARPGLAVVAGIVPGTAAGLLLALVVEPRLRRLEPVPARQRGGDVDLAPFHVAGRLLKFRDLPKERLHEPLHPPVAVDTGLGPVVRDQ